MRSMGGEAGPFDLSRSRRAASDPDGLVRVILYRGPIPLVAGVHTSPKHTRVYLRHHAVVVRPCFYPIRSTLRPLHLPVNRNLHPSDQLPHANLQVTCTLQVWANCIIACANFIFIDHLVFLCVLFEICTSVCE